jgi:gluconokinase
MPEKLRNIPIPVVDDNQEKACIISVLRSEVKGMKSGLKIVFMGVSGSGKTTLAARVATFLGCGAVIEADSFHTAEMKEKMRVGTPLCDEDRWPWLERIHQAMLLSGEATAVVTCSALRRVYREKLAQGALAGRIHFLFLDAPRDVVERRVATRKHEFMPAALLASQYEILERPSSDEAATTISVVGTEEEAFESIRDVLVQLRGS